MKVLIGADLVPTKSNYNYFLNGMTENLICDKLKSVLAAADFRIFNLEVPLSDSESPISKKGPCLIAPVKSVNGINALSIDLLTLANNHIMDQGIEGLKSTIDALEKSGIKYIGAGSNIAEAQKPYVLKAGEKSIGVYACAEHEFSIANEETPGANPFEPLESPDYVAELKKECDYVIVLYHGGKEHYRYPSPELQKRCRKLVEKGADLIVCQHSHCIGCEEKYQNGTIVYGQGNFLFDDHDNEFWNTSLLIEVDIGDDIEINYIPLCKNKCAVRLADEKKAKKIISEFDKRSEQIKECNFVENKYSEFASEMLSGYISSIYGTNILFRIINKLCGHKLKRRLSDKKSLSLINYLDCEAHRELLTRGLKNYLHTGEKNEEY